MPVLPDGIGDLKTHRLEQHFAATVTINHRHLDIAADSVRLGPHFPQVDFGVNQ
jgi:hypothetical protein